MSETMIETCVLTLGELMNGKVQDDKLKQLKEQCGVVATYFNDKKYKLVIPFYQRPYVWDTERVKILLEDLDEYLQVDTKQDKNKPEKYLLGSLIIYYNDNKNEFEIVDGQQRLVSLALILLCLEKLEKGENATIEFLKDSKFTHNESKVHISQNYKYIQSWFSSKKGWKIEENEKHKDDDIQKYRELLKTKIEFIYVKAPSLDDAFIFFDSANAKGARLKAYDLVKAFHLRTLEDTEPIQKHKEKLRAIGISPDDKDALIEHYAKYFEKFAKQDYDKNKKVIEILFNETLTPARRWIKHNSNEKPSEMDIYGEFCAEIPQRFKRESAPLNAKDSLGILQNFMGGVDFFEYLQEFKEIYDEEIKNKDFFKKLKDIGGGIKYNLYMYIMAMLIYFDKFRDSSNKEYMVRLIARAVFSVRVEQSKVYEATIKKYAIDEKLLSLIYFTSYEKELENDLNKFIDNRRDKESNNDNRTKATNEYLRIVQENEDNNRKTEYGRYNIMPHPESKNGGANNE